MRPYVSTIPLLLSVVVGSLWYMADEKRALHLLVPQDLWDRMEVARGDVPRSVWVRRALEVAMSPIPHVVEKLGGETVEMTLRKPAFDPASVPGVQRGVRRPLTSGPILKGSHGRKER